MDLFKITFSTEKQYRAMLRLCKALRTDPLVSQNDAEKSVVVNDDELASVVATVKPAVTVERI